MIPSFDTTLALSLATQSGGLPISSILGGPHFVLDVPAVASLVAIAAGVVASLVRRHRQSKAQAASFERPIRRAA